MIQSYFDVLAQHAIDGPDKQVYWLQKQYPDLLDADAMLALLVANDYDVAACSSKMLFECRLQSALRHTSVLCAHVRALTLACAVLLHCCNVLHVFTDTQEALRAAFPEVDAACEIAAERAAIAQHMLKAITAAATANSAAAASTTAGHSRGACGGYYSRYTDSTALAIL
eukprot:20987-Heterococcus_DN1.PRE.2